MAYKFAPQVTGKVGTLAERRRQVTALYGGYALFCFSIAAAPHLTGPLKVVGLVGLLASFFLVWWGFFTLTGLLFGNRAVQSEDEIILQARRDTIKRRAQPFVYGAVLVAGIYLGAMFLFPTLRTIPFIVSVLLGAFLVAATAPAVLLAWTEPDYVPDFDPYDAIDHHIPSIKLFGE